MTLLKKLVCKSVKNDPYYCGDADYERRFDQASACVQYQPREPRKKSRRAQHNSAKQQRRRRARSEGRQLRIPRAIPEQTGISYKHPEFDDFSEHDFVVNAVRKSLNHQHSTKGRGRNGLCQRSDGDSISTASSLSLDMHGTHNPQYYYGNCDESDAVSEEGRQIPLAPSFSQLAPTMQIAPKYKSARPEEDEAEGYLDQCMGMMADLLVGEAAVPRDPVKQKRIVNGQDPNAVVEESTTTNRHPNHPIYDMHSQAGDDKTMSSQNTYTDESSQNTYSTGQSSYEDSMGDSELESNIFCVPR